MCTSSTELVSDDFPVLHLTTPSQSKSIYEQLRESVANEKPLEKSERTDFVFTFRYISELLVFLVDLHKVCRLKTRRAYCQAAEAD